MAEHTPKRFKIMYRNGAYYVSIPEYQGGEVVDASIADALVKALERLASPLAFVMSRCATEEETARMKFAQAALDQLRDDVGSVNK
jgi:hypothetical protein